MAKSFTLANHRAPYLHLQVSNILLFQNKSKQMLSFSGDSMLIGLTLAEDIEDQKLNVGATDTGLINILKGKGEKHISYWSHFLTVRCHVSYNFRSGYNISYKK